MRDITLDHVAVALRRWDDGWPRFVGQLGARWRSSGRGAGFAPSQLEYANGMRIELLEPNDVHVNDFLQRFLDAGGARPHHLTYKVRDIEAAIGECRAAGIEPVGVDLRFEEWKEAFLHPKAAALGVVVQLAESNQPPWSTPPPAALPTPVRPPAALDYVGHAVADLHHARRIFGDLLGGAVVDEGGDEGCRWLELAWPGPGRVRLLAPTGDTGPLVDWLAGGPGRIHHLAFTCDDSAAVAGATPLASGAYVVAPDDATGTRLVLRANE
jgi:methylmalonyl-CoA/ethylmalonyl-CoA epimerase